MKRLLLLLLLSTAYAQSPANPKQDILWQKLDAEIHVIDQHLDGVMGVALEDLTTGRTIFLHADDVFATASTIKVPLLAELYRQDQTGKTRLTDLYTVDARDLVPDSYIMGGLTPGVTRVTNRDLGTMVVAVSDNAATNVLIDRVGFDNVNAFLDSLGLRQTRLRRKMMDLKAASEGRENVSTPREMMTLFALLRQGKLLDAAHTEGLLRLLRTHKASYIPRYLPEVLPIANKPGDLEGVRNDCGVIEAQNRPFALCVMTGYLRNEAAGEEAIAQVARAAYQMFDRLGRASDYGRVISPNNSNK